MKDIRDPLYGFVSLDDLEESIVDLPEFQRLRHILQLSTVSFVYPSANHSRFEHSLGVIHVSTLLLDRLVQDRQSLEILGWDGPKIQENRRLLRLASLLHDIGHPPFSHASEDLFPADTDHETYTSGIITSGSVAELITGSMGEPAVNRIACIATGRNIENANDLFLSQLITGELGSDRLDYLARDSHHLGVPYGKYDLHHFINGLTIRFNEVTQSPELVIVGGHVHTVEGILLARYYMFLQVYYHKTARILDVHLREFLGSLLDGGRYPTSAGDFLTWNDHRAIDALLKSNNIHHQRLLRRGHYRLGFETAEHPDAFEIERFDWLKAEVIDRFGEGQVRIDEARRSPYNYEKPLMYAVGEGRFIPLQERSRIISSLRPIARMRLYCNPEVREDATAFCRRFWQEREEARRGMRG